LNAGKRELLADCALPVAVLTMSFFGSYVFRDVQRKLTQHRTNLELLRLWGAGILHVLTTGNSATADGPRDALCQSTSRQL